jgi:uncharacterized protein (DUF1800 family)
MKRFILLASLVLALNARQRAQHALDRLAFGAKPGDVERVMAIGVDRWIAQQLHPEQIADGAVEAHLASMPERARPLAELSAQRIVRATESERQLNEVMTDFWLNHFNVFAQKGLDRIFIAGYERDVIRPHEWGKFEDLLMATAKSPAMLFYLDNARSRGGALNENYARELMELHTLGVDGGYTQKDVTELARVFTGWSIDRDAGDFIFRRFAHDRGEKTVLGVHFRAGGGMEEGERMIRFLAHRPATAQHIAYKLCQRLIADEPPASAVDRVAKTFLASDGDLRRTVQAVIESPEFRDPKYFRVKTKTPFEYAVSAIRAVDGRIVDPLPVARQLREMGEGLYLAQPPTGYSDTAQAWSSSGGLMARLNFALALAENRLPGVQTKNKDTTAVARFLGSPDFQKQ